MNEEQLKRLRAEMSQQVDLFRRLMARFGSGVLDVLAESVSERARDNLAAAGLPKRDLDSIMVLLWDHMDGNAELEVIERNARRLELRVTRCVYAEEMRKLGAGETGLAAFCAYDEGFCQGLNPHIRFSRTQTLMAGDDCCNHTDHLEP